MLIIVVGSMLAGCAVILIDGTKNVTRVSDVGTSFVPTKKGVINR